VRLPYEAERALLAPLHMNTPILLPAPVLGLFGIDDAIIIIILLVIIAAALLKIAVDLHRHWANTSAPTPNNARVALESMEALLRKIQADGGTATPRQCEELRRLLEEARGAGVGGLVIDALRQRIDQLCPG